MSSSRSFFTRGQLMKTSQALAILARNNSNSLLLDVSTTGFAATADEPNMQDVYTIDTTAVDIMRAFGLTTRYANSGATHRMVLTHPKYDKNFVDVPLYRMTLPLGMEAVEMGHDLFGAVREEVKFINTFINGYEWDLDAEYPGSRLEVLCEQTWSVIDNFDGLFSRFARKLISLGMHYFTVPEIFTTRTVLLDDGMLLPMSVSGITALCLHHKRLAYKAAPDDIDGYVELAEVWEEW